jgi:hypothetical protein
MDRNVGLTGQCIFANPHRDMEIWNASFGPCAQYERPVADGFKFEITREERTKHSTKYLVRGVL